MKTATERQSRVALADYADAKRHNDEKRAEKRRIVEKLLREGLPSSIIAIRAKCSRTYANDLRQELGLPIPTKCDWKGA